MPRPRRDHRPPWSRARWIRRFGFGTTERHQSQEQRVKRSALVLALSVLCPTAALADPALDALVAAYPDHLAGYDATDLIWKDGTRMPISDGRAGKSFEQLLDEPDIK